MDQIQIQKSENKTSQMMFEVLELQLQKKDVEKRLAEKKGELQKFMKDHDMEILETEEGTAKITEVTGTKIDASTLLSLLTNAEMTPEDAETYDKLFKVNVENTRKFLGEMDFNKIAAPGKPIQRFEAKPKK